MAELNDVQLPKLNVQSKAKGLLRLVFWWLMRILSERAYNTAERVAPGGYKCIAIDLDGVLAVEKPKRVGESWDDWYAQKKVMPGAVEAVRRLKKAGWFVYVYTARNDCDKRVTKRWLKENGIEYDVLVLNKPPAAYLVDDRAISFSGWDKVLAIVEQDDG